MSPKGHCPNGAFPPGAQVRVPAPAEPPRTQSAPAGAPACSGTAPGNLGTSWARSPWGRPQGCPVPPRLTTPSGSSGGTLRLPVRPSPLGTAFGFSSNPTILDLACASRKRDCRGPRLTIACLPGEPARARAGGDGAPSPPAPVPTRTPCHHRAINTRGSEGCRAPLAAPRACRSRWSAPAAGAVPVPSRCRPGPSRPVPSRPVPQSPADPPGRGRAGPRRGGAVPREPGGGRVTGAVPSR